MGMALFSNRRSASSVSLKKFHSIATSIPALVTRQKFKGGRNMAVAKLYRSVKLSIILALPYVSFLVTSHNSAISQWLKLYTAGGF